MGEKERGWDRALGTAHHIILESADIPNRTQQIRPRGCPCTGHGFQLLDKEDLEVLARRAGGHSSRRGKKEVGTSRVSGHWLLDHRPSHPFAASMALPMGAGWLPARAPGTPIGASCACERHCHEARPATESGRSRGFLHCPMAGCSARVPGKERAQA